MEIMLTGITIEELLLEDISNVFQVGSAIYNNELGEDNSLHSRNTPEFDHKIDLLSGTTSPSGPLYPCSTSELKSMTSWLENNSEEGKIRMSTYRPPPLSS